MADLQLLEAGSRPSARFECVALCMLNTLGVYVPEMKTRPHQNEAEAIVDLNKNEKQNDNFCDVSNLNGTKNLYNDIRKHSLAVSTEIEENSKNNHTGKKK